METQAYFDNIREVIRAEIGKAQSEICVAVPWFTDDDLLAALVQRSKNKVVIRLITIEDDISRAHGVDTSLLQSAGGRVYKIMHDGESSMMHNKFCVIDRNTVITGSYNWSRKAQLNNENITVAKGDYELSLQFVHEFNRLVEHYFGEKAAEEIDIGKLVKRLQVVKNFISLGETDELPSQIAKLRTMSFSAELNELIHDIEAKRYSDAVTKIESFINRYQQLALYEDPELNALKVEIKALELELTSISNEKADAEKLVVEFGIRHNQILGAVISKILKLKIELLKKEVPESEEKQKEFEEAKKDYEEYHKQYEETKSKKHFDLSEEQQAELKKKYREATRKCHPDRVAEELKKQAEEVFNELQQAYQENDLKRVTEILDEINKGIFFVSRSEKISEKTKLKAEATRLRNQIKKLVLQLTELKSSETYQTISKVQDWEKYFGETKEKLEEQLKELEKKAGTTQGKESETH